MNRKANWLCDFIRRDELIFDAIEGTIEGTRRIGSRKLQILDNLTKIRSYGDVKD